MASANKSRPSNKFDAIVVCVCYQSTGKCTVWSNLADRLSRVKVRVVKIIFLASPDKGRCRYNFRVLPAIVGDISSEGIFLKLTRGPLAALKSGTMVDVEISFEGDTVTLFGEIRSEHEGGYGVYFPERDPAGRANPLNRFGRISAQLQRSSLSQRLKILKLPT